MRVISFDPGYDRLGVAIIEKRDGKEFLLYSTCIETNKAALLEDRIFVIGEAVTKLLKEYTPQMVAIETLFFNKNIKTAIGVAQVRGVLIYCAKVAGCEVVEYGPQAIKVAVTGYGNSDKAAVIAMVSRLITNAPTNALDDEYDAIAVGITALAHHR